MGRLILSTTMTVDASIDVGEWYVPESEHDSAARDQFRDQRSDGPPPISRCLDERLAR